MISTPLILLSEDDAPPGLSVRFSEKLPVPGVVVRSSTRRGEAKEREHRDDMRDRRDPRGLTHVPGACHRPIHRARAEDRWRREARPQGAPRLPDRPRGFLLPRTFRHEGGGLRWSAWTLAARKRRPLVREMERRTPSASQSQARPAEQGWRRSFWPGTWDA